MHYYIVVARVAILLPPAMSREITDYMVHNWRPRAKFRWEVVICHMSC
jgi:hypothetical protein